MADLRNATWDELHRQLTEVRTTVDALEKQSANVPARTFTICEDHKDADWNQPAMEGVDCILCRLFYLEAQESLLEEWQQRATRAEEAIAEIKRPLDEQMARLNETVTRLNVENERLLAQSATASPTERDAKRYAARRWTIYHGRLRLQVGGPRQSFEDFVKEYDRECDKEVVKFEVERREYGPVDTTDSGVKP